MTFVAHIKYVRKKTFEKSATWTKKIYLSWGHVTKDIKIKIMAAFSIIYKFNWQWYKLILTFWFLNF